MRVVIVTSSLTYVKDNYYSLLKYIYEKNNLIKIDYAALIFIKTTRISNLLKAIALYFTGAKYIALILIKNFISSVFYDKRIKLCKEFKIPVYRIKNINDEVSIRLLKKLNPELIINIRTRDIYKKNVLDIPSLGCINIHHGILPQNRGTMCDLWAWIDKREVGFSIHWMNERIDDGRIIFVKRINTKGVTKYIDIPYNSSLKEKEELFRLLKNLSSNKRIKTKSNKSKKIIYSKTPDLYEIKKLLKKGIEL